MSETTHASDCALHNAPALPTGPCDCGAELTRLQEENERLRSALEDLMKAVDTYLGELDAPVPDYILRRRYLADLRSLTEAFNKAKGTP